MGENEDEGLLKSSFGLDLGFLFCPGVLIYVSNSELVSLENLKRVALSLSSCGTGRIG